MEEHIFRVTLDLYGGIGWVGFNLTKIAAKTGVDRSSLYSRRSDRSELLHHAFAALMIYPGPHRDSPQEILVSETDFRLWKYLGPNRSAVRRLFVEAGNAEDPIIYQIYKDLLVTPLSAIHERLWDFRLNGKLPHNTSVVRLFDAIERSILMHTLCFPDNVIACSLEKVPAYVVDLVDDQPHHHEPSRQLDE